MRKVTFEIYNDLFFLECEVEIEKVELFEVIANLRAMPNVRNIQY